MCGDFAGLVFEAKSLAGGLVSDVKDTVGEITLINGSYVADTAEAILLREANDAIVARKFGFAARKKETRIVLVEECEGRALRASQAKQRAFLPTCHCDSLHQAPHS